MKQFSEQIETIGTLSKDDDDGSENVAKKMNLRSFKHKKKFLVVCSIKRQIRKCHVVVVQWTSKKCTEKRDTRAKLLFWSLIKPIVFWSRRCGRRRRRSCLSSLMSTINDILAAVSLQTALSPRPFSMISEKLLDDTDV